MGKGYFLQLCPIVAKTWFQLRSEWFFWSKKIGYLPENFAIGPWTPFAALCVGSILVPSHQLCNFSFRSYARFRKKTADTPKSLPPPHCMEHRLPVTALALSTREAKAGKHKICLKLIYFSFLCSFLKHVKSNTAQKDKG